MLTKVEDKIRVDGEEIKTGEEFCYLVIIVNCGGGIERDIQSRILPQTKSGTRQSSREQ